MEAVNRERHLLVFNWDPCTLWKHSSFPVAKIDFSDSQVQEGWQNAVRPPAQIQVGVWGQLCLSICGM